MKNALWLLFILAIAGIAATYNPDAKTIDVVTETESGYVVDYAPTGMTIAKTWSLDTITNAENDTLLLNYILASPYQYSYQIKLANISGTRGIKFYLEQTNATGSTRWMAVDSAVTSGSTINAYLMEGANTWGNKHRIIVDGSGTQVVSYHVDGWLKKTN